MCVSPCPCPVLSHLSPDLHLSPCFHPCLTPGSSLSPCLPHSLSWSPSYPCLLCLCLVPISIPAFLLHALQLCLYLCPCGPTCPCLQSLSRPCLSLASICVPVSLLSLSPSLFLSLSPPVSSLHPRPHLRLRLFLVRVSIPLLDRLRGPRRDRTSLGAGPRGWIRITRLSGRIELTSSPERRQACLPSLLRGRRWGGRGNGLGPFSLALCVESEGLIGIGAG